MEGGVSRGGRVDLESLHQESLRQGALTAASSLFLRFSLIFFFVQILLISINALVGFQFVAKGFAELDSLSVKVLGVILAIASLLALLDFRRIDSTLSSYNIGGVKYRFLQLAAFALVRVSPFSLALFLGFSLDAWTNIFWRGLIYFLISLFLSLMLVVWIMVAKSSSSNAKPAFTGATLSERMALVRELVWRPTMLPFLFLAGQAWHLAYYLVFLANLND